MRLALLALLATGCSGFIDNKAAESTLRILEKSQVAAARTPDLQLAREAMPGGIIQLEAFALAYPGHRKFREMHADALCQYGVAFVFDDWEDASLGGRSDEAARIAERLRNLLRACIDANTALGPSTQHDLWLGTVGAVQLAIDPFANVANLPKVKERLASVVKKAPGFRNADAELLLGTLESATYKLFGGGNGVDRFEAARKHTGPGYLNVDVMYARAIAVTNRDRKLFAETLEGVLKADVTKWPQHRLANELARKKARRYLAAIDRLIPASK